MTPRADARSPARSATTLRSRERTARRRGCATLLAVTRRRTRSETERRADLDALLADPAAAWGTVMTVLSTWPSDQAPDRAIAAVEAVADRWPPATRGLPRAAIRQLLAGDVRPHLRLVRALDLRPLWSSRDRVALLDRLIAEGGVCELHTFIVRYDDGEALLARLVRHVRGLRVLRLGGCRIGLPGARALADGPALAELRELALHNNRIDDDGAGALAGSPHLARLRTLNLYNNCPSRGTVAALRELYAARGVRLQIHHQRPPGADWP